MQPSIRKWKELTPTQRVFVIVGAVVQITLLAVAQRDLSRRPPEEIRGPKGLWRMVTMINFLGPLAYLLLGRKPTPASH